MDNGVQVVGFIPHQRATKFCENEKSIALADSFGVPVINTAALEVVEYDLGLSLMFDRKLLPEVIDRPRLGWVNIHLGPLPRFRGSNSAMHAIRLAPLENAWEFAVTMHYMDEGLDTGPIIDQETVPIGSTDTAHDLYIRALNAVPRLFLRNFPIITSTDGRVPSRQQEGISGFYLSREVDHEVDLTANPQVALSKIRSLSFLGKPRPFVTLGDTRVFLSLEDDDASR